MRISIPFVPLNLVVERRSWEPFRITVGEMMVLTACVALYLGFVVMPARRERFEKADAIIHDQISVLQTTATRARDNEKRLNTKWKGIEDCLTTVRAEAAKRPEGSEERQYFEKLEADWLAEAKKYPAGRGSGAARTAQLLEERIALLQKEREEGRGSLSRFEQFAKDAPKLPITPEWKNIMFNIAQTRKISQGR